MRKRRNSDESYSFFSHTYFWWLLSFISIWVSPETSHKTGVPAMSKDNLVWVATPKPVKVFVVGLIALWLLAMVGLLEGQVLYSLPIALWILGFMVYSYYTFELKKEDA